MPWAMRTGGKEAPGRDSNPQVHSFTCSFHPPTKGLLAKFMNFPSEDEVNIHCEFSRKSSLAGLELHLDPWGGTAHFGLLKAHKLAPHFTFLLSWLRIQIQIQENLFKAELNA